MRFMSKEDAIVVGFYVKVRAAADALAAERRPLARMAKYRISEGVDMQRLLCVCATFIITFSPSHTKGKEIRKKEVVINMLRLAKHNYRQAEFNKALVLYKKAFSLVDHPDIAFNIAQCYRQIDGLKNRKKAIFYYRLHLSLYEKQHNGQVSPRKKEIDSIISALTVLLKKSDLKRKRKHKPLESKNVKKGKSDVQKKTRRGVVSIPVNTEVNVAGKESSFRDEKDPKNGHMKNSKTFPFWPSIVSGGIGLASLAAGIALLSLDGKGADCIGEPLPDYSNYILKPRPLAV